MTLEWLRKDDGLKDHGLFGEERFGTAAPSVIYEKRPACSRRGSFSTIRRSTIPIPPPW